MIITVHYKKECLTLQIQPLVDNVTYFHRDFFIRSNCIMYYTTTALQSAAGYICFEQRGRG